jgi:beta-1,4-mannosyl-glycoprotein beta-1,4-N-acetylglucosaminyltransferase
MKKYDTFIFFNELDILELRLNMLYEHVDYFVLVEATKTFTGVNKPLYYNENKERFSQFNNKIIHIIVNDMPDTFIELSQREGDELDKSIIHDCLTTPNVPKHEVHWLREFYQKEQVKKGLINCNNDDIIFVSDLDEIWESKLNLDYNFDGIYRFNQKVYTYYLNVRSNEDWYGTVATKYKNIKNYSINHIRTANKETHTLVPNGGWHFTFQGGAEMVKMKIESYGHQELNTDYIKSSITGRLENNIDVFGRGFILTIENDLLPECVISNPEKYRNLIKQNY